MESLVVRYCKMYGKPDLVKKVAEHLEKEYGIGKYPYLLVEYAEDLIKLIAIK